MSDDKIAEIKERHSHDEHWRNGPSMGFETICPQTHDDRATLLAEVYRQRAEIERLRAEIERLRTVYVLIVSEEAGPIDSATCWHEDKIIGCYISREAAEGAAKLLMADWRISEYALEGKP